MKKSRKIIFWCGIILTLITVIFSKPLSNLDELWNFNFARCIANGLVPYKDISMIITPLSSFLLAIPLKIFGSELFISRIMAVILSTLVLIFVYKSFRKSSANESISYMITLIFEILLLNVFCYDYNFLILLLALFIIILELKMDEVKDPKKRIFFNILIGLIGGFAICTKQTIGLILCFIILVNKCFFIKEKKDIKPILKDILFRFIGILMPVAALAIYLLANNAFSDFMNYCVKGIKDFSNKISYFDLLKCKNLIYIILAILVPVILLAGVGLNVFKKIKNKVDYKLYILTIYALAVFVMVYPIADYAHFLTAIIPAIILGTYIMLLVKRKYIKFNCSIINEIFKVVTILLIIGSTLYIEYSNYQALSELSKYRSNNHFKFITTSNTLKADIDAVDNFIKNSDVNVYIIDAEAAVYMIPADKYNKNYDMFLLGNIGFDGETKTIEKIKNEEALYLIKENDENLNWQLVNNVRAYIKENLTKENTVGQYSVYRGKIQNPPVTENAENTENNENVEQITENNQ